jgi:hypothetical protein
MSVFAISVIRNYSFRNFPFSRSFFELFAFDLQTSYLSTYIPGPVKTAIRFFSVICFIRHRKRTASHRTAGCSNAAPSTRPYFHSIRLYTCRNLIMIGLYYCIPLNGPYRSTWECAPKDSVNHGCNFEFWHGKMSVKTNLHRAWAEPGGRSKSTGRARAGL